jgi:hypothetical protein
LLEIECSGGYRKPKLRRVSEFTVFCLTRQHVSYLAWLDLQQLDGVGMPLICGVSGFMLGDEAYWPALRTNVCPAACEKTCIHGFEMWYGSFRS